MQTTPENGLQPETKRLMRKLERILKLCRQNVSLLFNQICFYIYIYMCVCERFWVQIHHTRYTINNKLGIITIHRLFFNEMIALNKDVCSLEQV